MSNIFKKKLDIVYLLNYIKNNSFIENNKYIIDNNTFKQSLYHNNVDNLLEYLKPFYYKSKQIYLKKKNYKNYLTIIRQICNNLKIKYEKIKKYSNSTYEIVYKIYVEQEIFNNVPNKLSTLTDSLLDNLENQL